MERKYSLDAGKDGWVNSSGRRSSIINVYTINEHEKLVEGKAIPPFDKLFVLDITVTKPEGSSTHDDFSPPQKMAYSKSRFNINLFMENGRLFGYSAESE